MWKTLFTSPFKTLLLANQKKRLASSCTKQWKNSLKRPFWKWCQTRVLYGPDHKMGTQDLWPFTCHPLSLSLSHPEPVISLGCPKKNLKNKNSCRWQQQWIDFTWLSNANQLPVVYPEISVTLTSQCCRHWYWTVSNDTQPYSDGHILYCQAWLKKKIIYILLIFKQHLHHAKLYLLI